MSVVEQGCTSSTSPTGCSLTPNNLIQNSLVAQSDTSARPETPPDIPPMSVNGTALSVSERSGDSTTSQPPRPLQSRSISPAAPASSPPLTCSPEAPTH